MKAQEPPHGRLGCGVLYAKGKELFDETLEQLKENAARIDPAKSWEEILEIIKADHPSEEGLITHYRDE